MAMYTAAARMRCTDGTRPHSAPRRNASLRGERHKQRMASSTTHRWNGANRVSRNSRAKAATRTRPKTMSKGSTLMRPAKVIADATNQDGLYQHHAEHEGNPESARLMSASRSPTPSGMASTSPRIVTTLHGRGSCCMAGPLAQRRSRPAALGALPASPITPRPWPHPEAPRTRGRQYRMRARARPPQQPAPRRGAEDRHVAVATVRRPTIASATPALAIAAGTCSCPTWTADTSGCAARARDSRGAEAPRRRPPRRRRSNTPTRQGAREHEERRAERHQVHGLHDQRAVQLGTNLHHRSESLERTLKPLAMANHGRSVTARATAGRARPARPPVPPPPTRRRPGTGPAGEREHTEIARRNQPGPPGYGSGPRTARGRRLGQM